MIMGYFVPLLKTLIDLAMIDDLDPKIWDYYFKIGDQVRKMRKERTKLNYMDFAKEIRMNRKTYHKIETGSSEYYISSLLRVLKHYPDTTAEKFFKEIGL